MTLPPPRHDCTNACAECDLGDTCPNYVAAAAAELESAAEYPCPHCNVPSWSADVVIEDGDGEQTEYTYRECPRCHHMWVPSSTIPTA
jgi:hypothetical protein